jgi:DsbC/DsbD-like thiol-disulfide interchange protein
LKPSASVSHLRSQMVSLAPSEAFRAIWWKGRFVLSILVCLFAFAAVLTASTGPHGTVELISEEASIQPGRIFRVGLHFQLEKSWHIYWRNPGDSGESPKVQWTLPTGFRAGPVQWPTPQRIADHTLIDYGYEDEVLLPVGILPPASLATGHDAELGASVTWLVCREICIPGRAALKLSLPVRKDVRREASSKQALFLKAIAELPKPVPKQWKLKGTLEGREFILEIETGRREAGATFFPLKPNLIENAAPQEASPIPYGIQLKLRRSDQLLKPVATLAGVLVLDSAHSFAINVPVRASNSR